MAEIIISIIVTPNNTPTIVYTNGAKLVKKSLALVIMFDTKFSGSVIMFSHYYNALVRSYIDY